jgi:V-type H+-transporting ATPase subunit H
MLWTLSGRHFWNMRVPSKSEELSQNWEDEDVPGLLDTLGERLAVDIQLLSSFDKYKREVLGGSLDWGPMHTSDQFWRENASQMEEKDFQIMRVLLKLLETSREVVPLRIFPY